MEKQLTMRVLYVGNLDKGGTCYSRMLALVDIGVEVIQFDTNIYLDLSKIPKIKRWWELLTLGGRQIKLMNSALNDSILTHSPDFVWLDTAFWLWPKTIKKIRATKGNIKWIHHYTDFLAAIKPSMYLSRRLLRSSAKYFDCFLTTNRVDFERLNKKLPNNVLFTGLGYDDARFNSNPVSSEVSNKWCSDLVFIGHYEPQTERFIAGMAELGVKTKVYGDDEWIKSAYGVQYPSLVGGRLSDTDYVNALKCAKIALCIFSKFNKNETSGRSFEIAACGTFMLGLRSEQHMQLYKEGVEAEFFSSVEEVARKAKYFLENKTERLRIAKNGNLRCVNSGYSWKNIMKNDWRKINQADT
jgi:spore maturation protein CgeB